MTILSTVVSGLKATKKGTDISSQNLSSGSLDPNYARRDVKYVTNQWGGGVEIAKIDRFYDKFLSVEIQKQYANLGAKDIVENYLSRIQEMLGRPNSVESLNVKISDVFISAHRLSLGIDDTSSKQDFLSKVDTLCARISSLAKEMYQMQAEVDALISDYASKANSILMSIFDINVQISKISNDDESNANLLDLRDKMLNELSNLMPISVRFDNRGIASVATTKGDDLVSLQGLRYLSYPFAKSTEQFSLGQAGEAITIDNQKVFFQTGVIGGLMKLRDKYIPDYLSTLNVASVTISDKLNEVYNDSAAGKTEYLSNKTFGYTDTRSWSGEFGMVFLDENLREKSNVVFNFQDIGDQNGEIDIKTFIQEINQRINIDPTLKKAKVGKFGTSFMIDDIRLAAQKDGKLAIEFQNGNIESTTKFTIRNYDQNGILTSTQTLDPDTNTPSQFKKIRGLNIAHRIEVDVEVSAYGQTRKATLDFNIPNQLGSGARVLVSTIKEGDGEIDITSKAPYGKVSLVDIDGKEIGPDSIIPGYLKITGNSKFILNQMDSIDKGIYVPNVGVYIDSSQRKISHFFGFNNMMKEISNASNFGLDEKFSVFTDGAFSSLQKISGSNINIDASASARLNLFFNGNNFADGDKISIAGQDFSFGNLAGNIKIGADLQTTLTNIVTTLNNSNVAVASVLSNGIQIISKQPGQQGNDLIVSTTFANQVVSLDSANWMRTITRNLSGGSDASIDVQGPDKLIVAGSSIAERISKIADEEIIFDKSRALPEMQVSVNGYIASYFSYISSDYNIAKDDKEMSEEILRSYLGKYKDAAQVDPDAELAKIMELSNAYNAISKALSIYSKSMLPALLEAI